LRPQFTLPVGDSGLLAPADCEAAVTDPIIPVKGQLSMFGAPDGWQASFRILG
jgi:hypothetical protein